MISFSLNAETMVALQILLDTPKAKYISFSTHDDVLFAFVDNFEYFKLMTLSIPGNQEDLSYRIPVEVIQLLLGDGTLSIIENGDRLLLYREVKAPHGEGNVVMSRATIAKEKAFGQREILSVYSDYTSAPSIVFDELSVIKSMHLLMTASNKGASKAIGVTVQSGWAFAIGSGFSIYRQLHTQLSMAFSEQCLSQLIKFTHGATRVSMFDSGIYTVCVCAGMMFGWRRSNGVDGDLASFLTIKANAVYNISMSGLVRGFRVLDDLRTASVKFTLDLKMNSGIFRTRSGEYTMTCIATKVSGEDQDQIELPFSIMKPLLTSKLDFGAAQLSVYDTHVQFALSNGIYLLVGRY